MRPPRYRTSPHFDCLAFAADHQPFCYDNDADGMIPLSIGLHFGGTQNSTAPGIQLAVIPTRVIFATLRIDAQCRLRDKLGSLEK